MLGHRASRYNFSVPTNGGALLYNTSSGTLLRLGRGDGEELANVLSSPSMPFVDLASFPSEIAAALREGGFVVTSHDAELEEVRQRFWRARTDAPIVVTITVTQDCNLRCFYCYEQRSSDTLVSADITSLLSRLDRSLSSTSRRDVHVDWYGGEPMLNAPFIEAASEAIQAFCNERRLAYSASIISNGTNWPEDPADFVRRHRIREVQISFDGDRSDHEKYRAASKQSDRSTFDEAVRVVDALATVCKVAVRLNLDRRTARTADAFVRFGRERGWFSAPGRAVLQPARLAAFSEHSDFMVKWQFSVTEFEEVKRALRAEHGDAVRIEEAETIDGFPRPRTSVCAALGGASFVMGADRQEYRCGLQVGEQGRALGAVDARPRHRLPLLGQAAGDESFWRDFDPTSRPRCRGCSFLPICWSGCPKRHLEGNEAAVDEYGQYWRENLARLVANGAGEVPLASTYGTDVQFRGETAPVPA